MTRETTINPNKGQTMFPEFRDLITQLKSTDVHFASLFQQHHTLDQQVKRLVSHSDPSTPEEIEQLKKEKLHLKDEMYQILKKAAQA
jgi:uncharacterized protein YdcH (DUF465 family)